MDRSEYCDLKSSELILLPKLMRTSRENIGLEYYSQYPLYIINNSFLFNTNNLFTKKQFIRVIQMRS